MTTGRGARERLGADAEPAGVVLAHVTDDTHGIGNAVRRRGRLFVASYMTAAHLIVVFPSADDRDLFTQARNARDAGRNPRVIEYEPGFGRAISWDQWVARGCPVHAYSGHTRKEGYDRL